MLLHHLRLLSFRAHADTSLSFCPKINLLYGPNGAGKTNVLEAIHYLCLSKSFLTTHDQHVLRREMPFFEVEGQFSVQARPELRVRLVYVPEQGKKILLNRAPLERLVQLVGMLPVVVVSPDDHALTAGPPEERRRFLNNILSQARPVYFDDLMHYRRALKQRNELLYHHRRTGGRGMNAEVLASWTEELVTLGTRVVAARLHFLQEFTGFLERAYRSIEAVGEHPEIEYQTIAPLEPGADDTAIRDAFYGRLERLARREREVGRTLVGPHLDELVFRVDRFEVRRYASQGQHRTLGMALKLAQFYYLAHRLDERPVLLLDDVFASLDPRRVRLFFALLQSDEIGQSFVTAADRAPFDDVMAFDGEVHQAYYVEAGHVQPRPAGS